MKRSYMISENYCKDWTITSALREVLANSYDTKEEVKLSFGNGVGHIHNLKTCLEKRHLLLGESNSREKADAIGQFGEGFKIAALVMCRDGRNFAIRSGNNSYKFSLENDADLGCNQLTVENDELHDAIPGTQCSFTCTEEEFIEAKNLFLVNHPERVIEEPILGDCQGAIYVSGVKVSSDYGTVFGYNFNDKTLINRDRSVIDKTIVTKLISAALTATTSEEVIGAYLTSARILPKMEHTIMFYPNKGDVWKSFIRENYGEKICLKSNEEDDKKASKLGYKIMNFGHYPNSVIHYAADIKYSSDIEEVSIPTSLEKTPQEREWIKKSKYYLMKFGIVVGEVYIYNDTSTYRKAEIHGEIIYLNRSQNESFPQVFKNITHRSAIIDSKNSMSLEDKMCEYFEKFADKLWNK